jgi:integration host factor subunit beta
MNKLELIQVLKDKTKLNKQEASEVVRLFFDSLTEAMINGDRIEIRGFCSFFIKEYAGYTGRNPKTGKTVQVPAKRMPFFKPGKELKERVDC